LLGTWEGPSWDIEISTLKQLFVSIQGQILIDTPVFNEPGWNKYNGTELGNKMNKEYNQFIRYYNICHSMIDMINHVDDYVEFKDVIINHFKLKKEYIIKQCNKWVNESYNLDNSLQHNHSLTKDMFKDKVKILYKLLDKI